MTTKQSKPRASIVSLVLVTTAVIGTAPAPASAHNDASFTLLHEGHYYANATATEWLVAKVGGTPGSLVRVSFSAHLHYVAGGSAALATYSLTSARAPAGQAVVGQMGDSAPRQVLRIDPLVHDASGAPSEAADGSTASGSLDVPAGGYFVYTASVPGTVNVTAASPIASATAGPTGSRLVPLTEFDNAGLLVLREGRWAGALLEEKHTAPGDLAAFLWPEWPANSPARLSWTGPEGARSNCGALGDCPWLVLSGPAGDYSFRVDLWTRNNPSERSNPWLLVADVTFPAG